MRSQRPAEAEERTHTGAGGRARRDPALRWGRARAPSLRPGGAGRDPVLRGLHPRPERDRVKRRDCRTVARGTVGRTAEVRARKQPAAALEAMATAVLGAAARALRSPCW